MHRVAGALVGGMVLTAVLGCAPTPTPAATSAPVATSKPRRDPAQVAAPPVTPPAAPEGVADGSALPSMPRSNWPCRIDVQGIDKVTWTFRYDGPELCWLPMELHAEGVVGCATGVDIANETSGYKASHEMGYDERGRLVEKDGIAKLTYTWDQYRVKSDGVFNYLMDGAVVHKVVRSSGKVVLAGDVNAGRLTRLEYRDGDEVTGVAELRWQGTHLVSFDTRSEVLANDVTSQTAIYDCD